MSVAVPGGGSVGGVGYSGPVPSTHDAGGIMCGNKVCFHGDVHQYLVAKMCNNSIKYSLWLADTDTDVEYKHINKKSLQDFKVTNKGRVQDVL